MQKKIRSWSRLLIVTAFVLSLLSIGVPVSAQESGETIADGLNGPMGVLVDPDGNIWVIDSGLGGDEPLQTVNPENGEMVDAGLGDSTRIVKIDGTDGTMTEIATLPSVASEAGASGGGRLALVDGTLYATVGEWLSSPDIDAPDGLATVVQVNDDGSTTEVAQFWPYERDVNPYPPVLHAHPYGIIGGPDGNLWVADAGGNHLAVVDPSSGEISSFAVFEPMQGVFPRPEYDMELLTDPVPTAVTIGADGEIYVSLLSGAPFVPGSAKVLKVGADGSVSDYADGLTMLTDLRTGPDGNLYATQFTVFGERGPEPASGAVVRIQEGSDSEIVASGLSFATSLDFNSDGDAYVTVNGVGAPGSGQVIKLAGLTEADGMLVSEAMAAMGPPPEAEGEMADGDKMDDESMDDESMDADAKDEMAEGEKTDSDAMDADAKASGDEMPAPETLPVTGDSANNSLTFLVLSLVFMVGGLYAFTTRRRVA